MKFPANAPVTPQKIATLRERVEQLGVRLAEISERFVRGGGPGGQKINNTSICVQLKYPSLGLSVSCRRERSRALNRFLALRLLVDKIEEQTSPETSKRAQARQKIRKQKRRRSRRSKSRTSGA